WRLVGCYATGGPPTSSPRPRRRSGSSRRWAPRGGRGRGRIWPRSIGSPCKRRCRREQPSPQRRRWVLGSPPRLREARTEAAGLGGEGRHSARLAFAPPEISSEVCEVCPNGRLVDLIGIEVGIIPFDHALMVEMSGVGDRLQKGLIAGRSADIRWGTAALRTDEARIIDAGRRFFDRLQLDRVSPIFPVHVVVPERFYERQHVGQRRRLGGARTRFRIIAIGQAPGRLTRTELERMAILPADRDLQHEMKVVETDG